MDKLSAFGRSVKLLTVRYPGLGLHSARYEMLTSHDGDHKVKEEEEEGFETVRSECMNPITDAHWQVHSIIFRIQFMSVHYLFIRSS